MFPQIFGKYVLERELASGGMARVYLATLRGAVGFEKRLVVKQIRPELSLDEAFVRRFVEEAKIAVELSHPNIVPVYELGVEAGTYYIAMELCEGLTLTEVLTDTGPLDAAEGAYVGIEICRALDYAHRRGGIVHRDVTPRNVLVDEEGAVRLIDFGIAAPASSGERVEVFGSPGHMPPEQIRGESLTPATDVFAVGALLIEAWTGRPPFRRGSFEASAEALKDPLPPLAELQPSLAPIAPVIEQSVALRPADRPQEAEALARRLREFSRPFDRGDVAKRLGARVQRARLGQQSWGATHEESSDLRTPAASPQAIAGSLPRPSGTPVTPPMVPLTPATPPMAPFTPAGVTGAPPITRTFAARDDLVEWTRKLNPMAPAERAAPEEPPEPTTRALPERELQPASTVSSARPWALLVATSLLVGGLAFAMRSGSTRVPAVGAAHSGVLGVSPVASAARSAVVSAPLPSSVGSAPPTPVEVGTSTQPVAPSLLLSLSAGRQAATRAVPLLHSSAVAEAPAQVRLTADPEATVTISSPGRAPIARNTPVASLGLPPGLYTVTFRSPTFGEPVSARVELAPGAFRSVHADFRAAVPTVAVR